MIAAAPVPDTRAPPERDYISFSAIKTYQQCPLRYFFKYIAGLPERTAAASLVFGSAVHHAIESHFLRLLEGAAPPSVDELFTAYQAGWREETRPIRFSKDDDEGSFDPLARRMLTAFASSELSRPQGRILAVEETLRGQLIPGLPEVLGRIDLIVETQDELIVSDWKTSRSRYSQDQIEDSAPQLLLYGELARDFAPGKRLKLQFGVLTKTKETQVDAHSFFSDAGQLDRTKRTVEKVWQAIEHEHYYPSPSTMNCPGCPYRDACRKWPG